MYELANEEQVQEFMRANFRVFCDQFGEPTMSGRKTPANGWRVKCEKVDMNYTKRGSGEKLTDWPPSLKLKAIDKARGLSINVELTYRAPHYHELDYSQHELKGMMFKAKWVIKRRTTGSGYETLANQSDTAGLPTNLIAQMDEAAAHEDVPEPRHFLEDSIVVKERPGGKPYVSNDCQIGTIKVEGVVSLKSKKVDMNPPQQPDQAAFFFCDGASHQGATFNMITDGEVFYPVTRLTGSTKGRIKIRNDFGKASMGTDLNQIDKLMVQRAIELYVERTFNAEQTDNDG